MTTPRLSDAHRAHLRGSGLTDATIDAMGVYTVEGAREVARLLGWKGPPRAYKKTPWSGWGPCIAFPVRDANGQVLFVRVRPDHARPSSDDPGAKIVKYEQPKKGSARFTFAPWVPRGALERLRDWRVPLVLTEGEKKAELLAQLGYAAIGATGVDCFHDPETRDKQNRYVLHRLILDVADLASRTVVVCFDGDVDHPDKGDEIRAAAARLGAMCFAAGAEHVVLAHPPFGDNLPKGIDDFFVAVENDGRSGAAAVAQLFAAAVPIRAGSTRADDEPLLQARARDTRPEIFLDADQEKAATAAIAALEREHRVYRRSNALVHIIEPGGLPSDLRYRDPDPVTVRAVEGPTLAEWIGTCARVTEMKRGNKEPTRPPRWLVDTVLARGSWPRLRHLEAMVATPVLLPDGTVLEEKGYDARTGLFLTGETLAVPRQPTAADVRAALELLADLVSEFPFAKVEHRSAWLAAVLTMLARFSFKGAAPLFLFDGSTAGSGKTILSGAAAAIGTGQVAPADSLPVERGMINEAELRKELLTWALAARRVVCFDNFKGASLDSGTLERAITSPVVGGRILGESRDWSGPLCCTWLLTGNNVEVAGDMQRRVLHVRLEPSVENPEERTFTRSFDAYVHAQRLDLTRAALVILRAFSAAGRPAQRLPAWGSFEAWSDIVRNAIVWAGWPDPFATREELRRTNATRGDAERAFILGWANLVERSNRPQGWTVREVIASVFPSNPSTLFDDQPDPDQGLQAAIHELVGDPDPGDIGKLLRKLRGRVVRDRKGPLHLDVTGTARGGVVRWGLVRMHDVTQPIPTLSADASHETTSDSDDHHGGDGGDGGDPYSHARADARAHARAHAHGGGTQDPHHSPHPHHDQDGESGLYDREPDDDSEPPLGRDGP